MKQVVQKELANSLNTLTAGTGVSTSAWGALEYWDFINTNAAGIGVLLTILFGVIAVMFNIYNSSKLQKVDKNKQKLDDHIKETKTEFKNINLGISQILKRINRD